MTYFFNLLIVVIMMSFASIAHAATFTVDDPQDAVDQNPGDGYCQTSGNVCTLRAAIMETNSLVGSDIIIIPPATYALTLTGVAEDLSVSGDLDITDSLTIRGSGARKSIIDASSVLEGVLHVISSNTISVQLKNLTLQGGVSDGGGGVLIESEGPHILRGVHILGNVGKDGGGGIYLWKGDLFLDRCFISRNHTSGGADPSGGGILIAGGTSHVIIANSMVDSNTADEEGGGIFSGGGLLILKNAIISRNRSVGNGGGISTYAETEIYSSTIFENSVKGIKVGPFTNGGGGGIISNNYNGGNLVTLYNTIVAGNHAPGPDDCATNKFWSGLNDIVSGGYNFIGNMDGCRFGTLSSDQVGSLNAGTPLNPMLVYTAWSVGLIPSAGSPVIDTGNPAGCVDENGNTIPFDFFGPGSTRTEDGDGDGTATCDVGASEYHVP